MDLNKTNVEELSFPKERTDNKKNKQQKSRKPILAYKWA